MIWSFLRNFYFGENWGFAESVIVQLIVVVFVIFFFCMQINIFCLLKLVLKHLPRQRIFVTGWRIFPVKTKTSYNKLIEIKSLLA